MRRPYQITGAVLVLLAIFIARESTELRYFTSLGPGPGFFPFWLALILGLLGALMFYRSTARPADPMPADLVPSRSGLLRMLAMTLALIWVIVFLEPLGFRLTMLAFLLFLLVALGREKPLLTVPIAVAGSIGVYQAFVEWFKIPLPVGVFGI